jgi:hypothetical protein
VEKAFTIEPGAVADGTLTWLDDQTGVQLSNPALFVHYLDSENHDNKLIQRLRWLPALSSFKEYVPVWLKQYQSDLELSGK